MGSNEPSELTQSTPFICFHFDGVDVMTTEVLTGRAGVRGGLVVAVVIVVVVVVGLPYT